MFIKQKIPVSHITNFYIPNSTLSTSQHYHECKFLKTVETIACNFIILHFLFWEMLRVQIIKSHNFVQAITKASQFDWHNVHLERLEFSIKGYSFFDTDVRKLMLYMDLQNTAYNEKLFQISLNISFCTIILI